MKHGPTLPPAVFKAMARPGSQSRGPGRKGSSSKGRGKGDGGKGGKGEGKGKFDPTKEFFVGDDGVKIPLCCRPFRLNNKCPWADNHPGQTCRMKHLTQAQFEAKKKSLNPGRDL